MGPGGIGPGGMGPGDGIGGMGPGGMGPGGAFAWGGDGLPGFASDVVVGAEVEDVPFVSVVFAVGVEGFDADSFDGGEVVDFDAFAGEGVEAETDGGFGAGGVAVFGGELGVAGDPGVEASFLPSLPT